MGLPYTLTRLSRGKLEISSPVFTKWKLNGPWVELLKSFPGIFKVNYYPNKGKIIVYYNESNFDLIDFLNFFEQETEEGILEKLSKVSPGAKREDKSTWLKRVSLGFVPYLMMKGSSSWFLPALTVMLSFPVFKKGLSSLKERNLDVHVLDSLALVLSILAKQPLSAHFMVWLLALGDYLEDLVEKKAEARLKALFDHKENIAYLYIEDGKIVEVSPESLKPGDKVVVYSGRKILIDGKVCEGEALVNQSSLTGESKPVHKKPGDKVYAGTVLVEGKIIVEVEKTGEETVFAGIVRLIEEGIKEPLRLQKKAEQEANRFVAPTLLLGIISLNGGFKKASSVLTFDFYTGVHFITPLTVLTSATFLAKRNILMKSGAKFEKLAEIDTVVFDKTGTLTLGSPKIADIVCFDCTEERLLQLAASLEQRIQHPVAQAITSLAEEKNIPLIPRLSSNYFLGLGIEGILENKKYALGSTKFVLKKRIKVSPEIRELVEKFHSEGKSVLYLIEEEKPRHIKGLLTFIDPPKPEARDVIETLKEKKLDLILCTGDNEQVAMYLSKKLGIDTYFARMLPQEKAELVKRLKKEGRVIAFVGDGLNDSPALTLADVGITFAQGAEVALEVADLVLTPNLWDLVLSYDLSVALRDRLTRLYFYNNLINGLGLVLSVLGLINPALSTLLNNGGTLGLGLMALRDFVLSENKSSRRTNHE
ncbi:MAG: heavy metal translocating P-type ATPase [Caldimicrobium sp.]|nr:heavy metal translocating P-type ATPase [Caldimicrobium sp.]MCX7873652.1 heavy metal translocating P-type ATPase [Caldimicrobium sp.]MDW8094343.1 heavy metal translocating P-type ATPase [Caldimicrobium sp.]